MANKLKLAPHKTPPRNAIISNEMQSCPAITTIHMICCTVKPTVISSVDRYNKKMFERVLKIWELHSVTITKAFPVTATTDVPIFTDRKR